MSRLTITITALLVGSSLGVLFVLRYAESSSRTPVSEPKAALPRVVEAPPVREKPGFVGVLVSPQAVDVQSPLEGMVGEVLVRMGDRVKKGQRLAMLSGEAQRKDVTIAEASALAATADADRAVVELDEAKERRAAAEGMSSYLSRQEVQAARYQEKLALARLGSARAAADERRAVLQKLRGLAADAEVRAPFDGVVAARYVDAGARATPGTPLLRLISGREMWVRFAIPEDYADHVTVGQELKVQVPPLGITVRGQVVTVAPEIDAAARMVFAEARLLSSEGAALPAGLVARVVPAR
jgi:RND family efflux transporter MFP subunit